MPEELGDAMSAEGGTRGMKSPRSRQEKMATVGRAERRGVNGFVSAIVRYQLCGKSGGGSL